MNFGLACGLKFAERVPVCVEATARPGGRVVDPEANEGHVPALRHLPSRETLCGRPRRPSATSIPVTPTVNDKGR